MSIFLGIGSPKQFTAVSRQMTKYLGIIVLHGMSFNHLSVPSESQRRRKAKGVMTSLTHPPEFEWWEYYPEEEKKYIYTNRFFSLTRQQQWSGSFISKLKRWDSFVLVELKLLPYQHEKGLPEDQCANSMSVCHFWSSRKIDRLSPCWVISCKPIMSAQQVTCDPLSNWKSPLVEEVEWKCDIWVLSGSI